MSNQHRNVTLNISFKNTDATEPLKNYVNDKLKNSIQKFIHHDTTAHVILKVEKNRQIAEVTFRTDGADFVAREESDNLYTAIDALAESLTHQLRKHKEKLTDHHP